MSKDRHSPIVRLRPTVQPEDRQESSFAVTHSAAAAAESRPSGKISSDRRY